MTLEAKIRLSRPLAGAQSAGAAPNASSGGPSRAEPPTSTESPADQALRQLEAERAAIASARQAMEQAVVQLDELQERFTRQAEEHLAELALGIARKVLMQEVQAGRYEIDPIVREALSRIPPRMEVVVHLNGEDLARCKLVSQEAETTGAGSIRFLADPKIPPAGCLLHTTQGTVESSIEEHLDQVAEALKAE